MPSELTPPTHPSLTRTDHRPWPLPGGEWTWRQSWRDLLFAHWPIPASALRDLVPPALEIQEFDGTSWIGLVPFRMAGVMRRPLPDLPYFSAFPEINLRLYVEAEGKPGVWFLSLEAANMAAVIGARAIYNLPYYHAQMDFEEVGDGFDVASKRRYDTRNLRLECTYQPAGEPYESEPGTLESWLTERYCLYAQQRNGSIQRVEVHHHPWPLQKAEAEIRLNTLHMPHGLNLEGAPPLLHFSRRIDVSIWPTTEVIA